ncbi:hypothetical protein [Natranaeroarchaeum aerophilus]|uniref:Chromosome segregation ATPase n=1 Tax=Natranaeroarchaeum aerophilus TaxID=2917711 RepID=A0AAE3FSF9_9EURY|nr:hypothetical protein [Natranaeroarchaeum aerophilus]MCL9814083.1 hypothetical protein [Natranaeroarchaeum aerophilus]
MTIGLDIDDRFTTVARDGVEPTTERTNFVELPDDEMVLDMLSSGEVEYVERDGTVYAVGNGATDFAGMFDAPVESLLRGGVLTGERDVDAVLAELLIEQVLGAAEEEERAVFAAPSEPVDRDVDMLFHRRTIDSRLGSLGYESESVTRGVAAGYAGFGTDAPTGVAVVLGTGTSEVCLLDDGRPVAQFGLGRGGNWIDKQVADATDRDPSTVADERETYDLTTGDGDVLGMYYENLLSYVVDAVLEHTEIDGAVLPVVVAGSAARPAGIGETLDELLTGADLSFEIEELRVLEDPITAVARGARLAPDVERSSVETATAVESGSASEAATTSSGQASSDSGGDRSDSPPGENAVPPDRTTTVEALDERITDLRERVDAQADQTAMSDLGEAVDGLDARLAEIEDAELASLSSELNAVADDVEQLRERHDDLAERQHSLDSRLEDTPDSDLEETVAELDDALSALREEFDGSRSRIEALETDVTEPADELLDRIDDIEATLDSREDLQSEVAALDQSLVTTGDDLDSAVERIEDLETHLDDVEARADTAIERTDGVVSRLDDVEADTETVRERVSETESRIERIEQEASSTDDRVDDLNETVDEQAGRIGAVELSNEAIDERVESIEGAVATVDDLSDSLEDAGERLDSLQSSLADADRRIAELETINERVDELEGTLDRVAELESTGDRVEELEGTLNEMETRYDDDVDALRSDLNKLQSQVESVIDVDDGPSDDEVREIASDVAREHVLAPALGGAGTFGLLAAGGAAVADALVLAGVFAALAIVCFGAFVRSR